MIVFYTDFGQEKTLLYEYKKLKLKIVIAIGVLEEYIWTP